MTENIAKPTEWPEIPEHWTFREIEARGRVEAIPRKIVVRRVDHGAGFHAPLHSHGWGQLLFIAEGLMQVSAQAAGYWVVPPQRAVWIPAFTEHEAWAIRDVKMRNVYFSPEAASGLPNRCQVIGVTPLLRELILAIAQFDWLYEEQGAEGRLVDVFLDQLKLTPETPLHLPLPQNEALQKITQALRSNPADQRSMEDWSNKLATSSRTLARRFRQETGMTFGQWRQQARLLAAITRLGQGDPISHIAQDLGYESQSAFITMFRKALGKTPGRYFAVDSN